MCQSGLLKALRELTSYGAIVLLVAGSDEFLKHIVDDCIYTDYKYDILELQRLYSKLFDKEEWIK